MSLENKHKFRLLFPHSYALKHCDLRILVSGTSNLQEVIYYIPDLLRIKPISIYITGFRHTLSKLSTLSKFVSMKETQHPCKFSN